MSLLNRLGRKIVLIFSWIISKIIDFFQIQPKFQAVLTSFPDFDDQLLVMALELSRRQIPIVVIAHTTDIPIHWLSENLKVKRIKMKSLQSLYYAKRSKYIFYTHGFILSEKSSKRQKIVNLWHGIPLKKIGFQDGAKMPKSDYILATSKETGYLMERSYPPDGIIPEVLYYGLPRVDLLELKSSNTPKGKLIWMPTFRNSNMQDFRHDGALDTIGVGMSEASLRFLDAGLTRLELSVELILHPMACAKIPEGLNAIKISKFKTSDESLYRYLNKFDALITDYSSVAIDYLVTQKPIYFLVPDYNEYINSRGLNESLESLLGLPVFKTNREFLQFLEDAEETTLELQQALSKWHGYTGKERSRLIWEKIQ